MFNAAIELTVPILLAAMGGYITEKSGVLNISLEGLIIGGAFFTVIGIDFTGSLYGGILCGILSGIVFSGLFSFFALYLHANIFIIGLGINILTPGLAVILTRIIYGAEGDIRISGGPLLPFIDIPWIESIPFLGPVISGHTLFVLVAIILVVALHVFMYRTHAGLLIRAVKNSGRLIRSRGVEPRVIKLGAILASGFFASLAGVYLALRLSAFVPGISSGRGWIALVAVFLGYRNPFGILGASFLFALADSFANYLQGVFKGPSDIILAIPFVVTAIGMILFSIVSTRNMQQNQRRRT